MQEDENVAVLDALTRMAALFGREALLPVVEGLQHELQRALDEPEAADAHRIAGLTGTLGFGAVSAHWQAVDRGDGNVDVALPDSQAALIAIDGWLRQAQ